jgi:hypothetical protein
VHPTAIRRAAESGVEPGDRGVQGTVEVLGARLGAYNWPSGQAGYLDSLAVLGLAGITLVKELDINPNYFLIVALDLREFLRYVDPEVVRHFDIATLDDDIHT